MGNIHDELTGPVGWALWASEFIVASRVLMSVLLNELPSGLLQALLQALLLVVLAAL